MYFCYLIYLIHFYFLLATVVAVKDLTTTIKGKIIIPNFNGKEGQPKFITVESFQLANIELVLNGGEYKALTTTTGEFQFYNVPAGFRKKI
jgi:hypothetical protein